jgi:ABC-2 type transport system permease protein
MRQLLYAELIKLRTTRTFYALAGVAIGLSMLITVLIAWRTEPTQDSVLTDVFTNDTSSLFIMILAVVGITGEWRHRTITSSLLAAPDRLKFLAAKTVAFAAAGVALSIAISLMTGISGYAILEARDLPTPPVSEVVDQGLRNALVASLLGAFGLVVGSLVRNQPIAIVGILILLLIIEPTLAFLAPDTAPFLPTSGLPTAIQELDPEDTGLGDVDLLSPIAAIGVLLAWIGALFAAGAALLIARDVE